MELEAAGGGAEEDEAVVDPEVGCAENLSVGDIFTRIS